jgi:hypothetical protein
MNLSDRKYLLLDNFTNLPDYAGQQAFELIPTINEAFFAFENSVYIERVIPSATFSLSSGENGVGFFDISSFININKPYQNTILTTIEIPWQEGVIWDVKEVTNFISVNLKVYHKKVGVTIVGMQITAVVIYREILSF